MGIRPRITFKNVAPKLEGGFKNIGLVDPVESSNIPFPGGTQTLPTIAGQSVATPSSSATGDIWKEFSLSLSVSDLIGKNDLKNYNDFLKKVNSITQIMVALIKIMRLFTSDLFSINKALKFVIKQIATTLKDLVNSFMASGVYYTVITPRQSENDEGHIVSTWGDFDEFRTVVIDTCTNTNDIGSPSQLNLDSYVGGFVIGGIAGSNNPEIIDTIYHNAGIISDLFGFKIPLPGPPKHLVALEGLYGKDNKAGIKLTWSKPTHYISNGFLIFRSTDKKGIFPTSAQMDTIIKNAPSAKDPKQVRTYQKIKLFDNKGLPNNSPVFIKYSYFKESYSYTDMDVVVGTKYYYRVYTVLKEGKKAYDEDPYFFRIDSPLSSNETYAIAYGCIPVSEISEGILTMDGDRLRKEEYANSQWRLVSLNRFFGSQLDKLLKVVEDFADKLIGYISTPSDAINDYLDFYSNKINDYIVILQTITNIINILVSFKLKGSMLFLDLFKPKKGGIQGFAERINRARVTSQNFSPIAESQIVGKALGTKGGVTKAVSEDAGQSLAGLRGIYYGLVVVYGLGNPADAGAYAAPYMEEYNDISKQLADNAKTFTLLKGILTGNWDTVTK